MIAPLPYPESVEVRRPYKPLPWQAQCLRTLGRVRSKGEKRSLVVVASGLGKTVISAADVRNWLRTNGGKVLYLCHHNDILEQAAKEFQWVLGDRYSIGFFHGFEKTRRRVDILFSSFQSMREHREEFTRGAFSYIVVDESHHGHAETYLPTLQYFKPKFLLGITATPDRADLKDIRDIYGQEVFSLPLEDALAEGLLSQVDYRLMTDELQNRSVLTTPVGKLSIKKLNRTLFVPRRDREIARLIQERAAAVDNPRVIIFCPSISYCERMARLLPHAQPLHSEIPHNQYQATLQGFRTGRISAVLTVDKFNEGIDIPDANVIVFLRSTSSRTIFLQQLGRGLRKTALNNSVVVLDFVANCERLEMVHNLWNSVRESQNRYTEDLEPVIVNIGRVEFSEFVKDVLAVISAIRGGYTREILLKQLADLAAELGRTPGSRDINEASRAGRCANVSTFNVFFGSINNALMVASLPLNKVGLYSETELVNQLQQIAAEIGRSPSYNTIMKLAAVGRCASYNVFRDHFGSFEEALEAAGLTPNEHRSKRFMIQQLKKLGEELGTTPKKSDVESASKERRSASSTTFASVFGSFSDALVAAGFEPNQIRYRSKDELIKLLQQLATRLGRTPGQEDLRAASKRKECPSPHTFARVFGSLAQAQRAAGLTSKRLKPQ